MKKIKKVLSLVLAAALGMAVSPFSACDNTPEPTPQGDERTTVSAIAPQLLDGKVANLMSAEGIAIQDKTQETATVSAVRTKGAVRKRYADPNQEKIEPAKNELVKKTKQGLQDVRFHGESTQSSTTNGSSKYHASCRELKLPAAGNLFSFFLFRFLCIVQHLVFQDDNITCQSTLCKPFSSFYKRE